MHPCHTLTGGKSMLVASFTCAINKGESKC